MVCIPDVKSSNVDKFSGIAAVICDVTIVNYLLTAILLNTKMYQCETY